MSTPTPTPTEQAGDLRARLEAFRDAAAVSRDEVENLYAMGYQFAAVGQLALAADFFHVLSLVDPTSVRHWRALALTQRRLGQHQASIRAFRMIERLEPDQPEHTLELAQACLLAGHFIDAALMLSMLVAHCETHGISGPVLDRARALCQPGAIQGALHA